MYESLKGYCGYFTIGVWPTGFSETTPSLVADTDIRPKTWHGAPFFMNTDSCQTGSKPSESA